MVERERYATHQGWLGCLLCESDVGRDGYEYDSSGRGLLVLSTADIK